MPSKISDVNRTLTGADISDNLAEIQGNIIKPYMFARQRGLFFKIDHGEPGRRWLGGLAERVTSAADSPEEDRPASALNVGISHFGLQALEPSDNALASFPPEFQAGAVGRAQILGDVGELSPENWEDGFGGKDIHVAVFVFADSTEEIESQSKWVRDIAKEAGGVTEMAAHDAYAFEDGVEHFGYRDGLTDVPIEGTEEIYPQNPGGGTRQPDGSWDAIKPGEFLLGYESETGSEPQSPFPRELAVNGTYIVYRKIYQDVAAFRKVLDRRSHVHLRIDDVEANQERLACQNDGPLAKWLSPVSLAGQRRSVDRQ